MLNGAGSPIQNSQCVVSGVASAAVLSGNILTLTLIVTFQASFTGNRILYAAGGRRGRKQHRLAVHGDLDRSIDRSKKHSHIIFSRNIFCLFSGTWLLKHT
ncbi:hypothetical protein SBA4_2370007 [Candidatus Sulfopaludibacter sp. SbA4]|nr:hypothetical protein SBA4_2370007 [Candidatus Sulfopaludibacter sp. SbA4]